MSQCLTEVVHRFGPFGSTVLLQVTVVLVIALGLMRQNRGNPAARQQLSEVMNVGDANWRGIGVIPNSGYSLTEKYAAHDARLKFKSYADDSRKRVGEMPAGCDCAGVVLGKIYPNQCRLYGAACTPRKPVGPCMVSDEGACRIWWSAGYRDNEWEGRKKRKSVG